jgi:hypothetical protein
MVESVVQWKRWVNFVCTYSFTDFSALRTTQPTVPPIRMPCLNQCCASQGDRVTPDVSKRLSPVTSTTTHV